MEDEYKRIFVLGNGFDLAHYLPTQYIHFIEAMEVIEHYTQSKNIYFDELFHYRLKHQDDFFKHTCELYATDDLFIDFPDLFKIKEKLKGNFWYQHFKKYLKVNTWIDVETEIENTLLDVHHILSSNFMKDIIYLNDEFGYLINYDFWESFGTKKQMYQEIFYNLKITSDIEHAGVDHICSKYVKNYGTCYVSFNNEEIYKRLSDTLDGFKIIFQKYISLVINKLEPKVPFYPFGDLGKEIEAVFTFNYSNSFERFYPNSQPIRFDIQYIHGSAEKENIVLGISELNEKLKKYKIFNFVKSYQSIIENTDYEKIIDLSNYLGTEPKEKFELLIWGHSLDVSDKKYILEMLNSKQDTNWESHVWYFQRPHNYLANLMSIMGEESVLKKIKNREIRLDTPAPDILEQNKDLKELF